MTLADHDLEVAIHGNHREFGHVAFAPEVEVDASAGHREPADLEAIDEARQAWADDPQTAGKAVGLEAEGHAEEVRDTARSPGLGMAGHRVLDGGLEEASFDPGEAFGQPPVVEGTRGLDEGLEDR